MGVIYWYYFLSAARPSPTRTGFPGRVMHWLDPILHTRKYSVLYAPT